jgi:hypothetical protein
MEREYMGGRAVSSLVMRTRVRVLTDKVGAREKVKGGAKGNQDVTMNPLLRYAR